MNKILSMAFMLCVCAGIHAEVGATAVVAPCEGVPNKTFMGEASEEQIRQAQAELIEECKKLAAKKAQELEKIN